MRSVLIETCTIISGCRRDPVFHRTILVAKSEGTRSCKQRELPQGHQMGRRWGAHRPGVGVTKANLLHLLFGPFFIANVILSICQWLLSYLTGVNAAVLRWQTQLSCVDTCQIWMWFNRFTRWHCKNQMCPWRKNITNKALVTPTPERGFFRFGSPAQTTGIDEQRMLCLSSNTLFVFVFDQR